MKLAILLLIITGIYSGGMTFLIREYATNNTKEAHKNNQSIPLMFAATLCFVCIFIQLIRLSVLGFLPLL